MRQLLKYTYLLDVPKVKSELGRLWDRYQEILKNPNWVDLNEARAILYLTGNIYCEKIAPEAIEKRLHLLKQSILLVDFFILADSRSKKLAEHRRDPLFRKLEDYYRVVKKFKNQFSGGKFYLDEEKFIKFYNKYNPDKSLKMREKGRFGKK